MRVVALFCAGLAVAAVAARVGDAHVWQRAYVTAYATFEHLEGCVAPGRCRTACGSWLDDRGRTVAANPRHGLGCGQRIVVCVGRRCSWATVTDRTGSSFDFEFSYALARATGASRLGWDSPRRARWRKA